MSVPPAPCVIYNRCLPTCHHLTVFSSSSHCPLICQVLSDVSIMNLLSINVLLSTVTAPVFCLFEEAVASHFSGTQVEVTSCRLPGHRHIRAKVRDQGWLPSMLWKKDGRQRKKEWGKRGGRWLKREVWKREEKNDEVKGGGRLVLVFQTETEFLCFYQPFHTFRVYIVKPFM